MAARLPLPPGVDPRTLVSSPATIASAPPAIEQALRGVLAETITSVFLLAVPVALVGFGLAWLLRELPLRRTTHASTGEVTASAPPAPAGIPPREPAPG